MRNFLISFMYFLTSSNVLARSLFDINDVIDYEISNNISFFDNIKVSLNNEYCSTKPCIIEALNFADFNLVESACDDFFQFSCKHVHQNHLSSVYQKVIQDVLEVMKMNFSSKYLEPMKDLQFLFNQCVNRDHTIFNDLMKFIDRNFNKWPLINYKTGKNFTTSDKILNLFKIGIEPFFILDVRSDIFNNSNYTLWLKRSEAQRLRIKNSKIQQHLIEIISDFLYEFDFSNHSLENKTQIDGLIRLSKKIHQINLKKKFDPVAFKTTISELNNLIPGFDWETYIVNDVFMNTFNLNVSLNQTVIIDDLEYLRDLVKIIEFESTVNENDFDNFLIWELIDSLNDITEPSENEQLICSNYIFKNFNVLLSRFILKDNFESKKLEKVEELIRYLRIEFKNLIRQSEWMDDDSKIFSIKRIENLKFKIGHPKYIFNDSLISSEYLKYNFSSSNRSFLDNEIFRRSLNLKDNFKYLNKKRNENIWLLGPSIPNAAFSVLTHEIYVPAGIIQTPIFDQNNLMLFNFARLGFIIAHEMAHAFSYGKFLNEKGFYFNNFNSSFTRKLYELKDCFIEEYRKYSDNYEDENEILNTLQTLEENMADNIGFRVALKAFKNWEIKNGQTKKLPLISFTNEQLFFMAYSQLFCDHVEFRMYEYEHSPSYVRLNAIAEHSKEFLEIFKCPINQKIENKICSIL